MVWIETNTLLGLEDFSGHGYSNKHAAKVVKQKKLLQFEIRDQRLPSYVDYSNSLNYVV